jgi:uncharacterized HAD superfamily protein
MIVIDIDNTVTNQIDRLRKNYDSDIETMRAKSTSEQELMSDLLFPNAMEVILKLAKNFDIIWLSARNSSLYEVTLKWIIEKKLPCKELILVSKLEDKLPILIKLNPTLFIDDLQYDLYSLNPKPALQFRDKLNKANVPYLVFNSNWLDVEKQLKNRGLLDI